MKCSTESNLKVMRICCFSHIFNASAWQQNFPGQGGGWREGLGCWVVVVDSNQGLNTTQVAWQFILQNFVLFLKKTSTHLRFGEVEDCKE